MRSRLLAVLLAATVFLSPALGRAWDSYPEINTVASWLAQRPVTVRCLNEREADSDPAIVFGAAAYVPGVEDTRGRWRPDDYAVFSPGLCEAILSLYGGQPVPFRSLAWAVLVLAHESGHLRGHRWAADESLTERWALRHYRYVALRLGMTQEQARRALAIAIRHHRALPDEYLDSRCRSPSLDSAGTLTGCD